MVGFLFQLSLSELRTGPVLLFLTSSHKTHSSTHTNTHWTATSDRLVMVSFLSELCLNELRTGLVLLFLTSSSDPLLCLPAIWPPEKRNKTKNTCKLTEHLWFVENCRLFRNPLSIATYRSSCLHADSILSHFPHI